MGSQGAYCCAQVTACEVATQFVRRYEEDPSILERIVTGDETWVHHYDLEQKTKHGMEASLLSSAKEIQKTAFRQESHVNALLGHAWTYSGAFPSARANSEVLITVQCCEMNLNLQFARKEEECCPKKVLLHHDNARPRTAVATVETVQQLLQHPPYSPDLAPSIYHIFGPLKEALHGRRFTSDEEVKEAVHTWLREQPKIFFSAGIQKLVERYNKCIVLQGYYVEK